jgi:hypothetical protein
MRSRRSGRDPAIAVPHTFEGLDLLLGELQVIANGDHRGVPGPLAIGAVGSGAEPGAYIERRAQLGPEEVNRRLLRAAELES